MRKKLIAVFVSISLILGIGAVSVRYYTFVSQTIYTESIAHLTEIYHQANQSFYTMLGRNWSTMHLWADYLQDVEDEEQIVDYVAHAKEKTGFTDFYFISRESSYRTVDGETGYLDLKENLLKPINVAEIIQVLQAVLEQK